ncbi:MAG: Fe-S cluster assembly protein SufD [Arenicella sp.]|nr:Fe-S cluster assembly protein SufD [Arenicella sp.]
MNIAADQNQSWLEQHTHAPVVGQELEWLKNLRAEALAQFKQSGLPGIRDEQWRHTNLRALKSNLYAHSHGSSTKVSATPNSTTRLVFVNGHFAPEQSSLHESDGITVTDLEQGCRDQSLHLQDHFSSTLPTQQHGFTTLNTAYCHGGYVIYLRSGTQAASVLEMLFINTAQDDDSLTNISHTRNLVVAEANTRCRIIERHQGEDGSVYLHNTITEIIAGENAHIDHYKIQQDSSEAFHIGGVFIEQAANAHVKSHNISLGGLLTRNDICCNLNGEGGHIEMNGLVFGKGRQHVDNHTQVNHLVPHCSSDEHYKCILDDHSRSVFRGRIVVAEDAQLTSADQQNNNLLLSANSEADSKPQLEIYADDVKCSHGATVGQLDPKSLFYLQSRGIDQQSASELLTFAFANQVIDRLEAECVREDLTKLIGGALLHELEDLL